MDNGEIDQVTNRLVKMQRSLAVLENDSNYEDRKNQLEELKSKLEVILTPMLIVAFENDKIGMCNQIIKTIKNTNFFYTQQIFFVMHITDESKRYVTIFTDLEKRNQIIKYYIKCNKNRLRKEWASKIYANEYSKNPLFFFQSFYESLMECKRQQVI